MLRIRPADLAKQSVYEGNSGYAGVDDHYFVTMAISPGPSKVSFHPVAIPHASTGSTSEPPAAELMSWAIEPASDGPIKFYAGPKDLVKLQAIDPALGKVIDFGWFDFIVVPLLRALNWIHGYVGNYGWSIIILTIIINAIMFPLRHKSVVSMRKMQEIQPEVKAIQERYAKLKTTDPARQKMNQELMALYRERGRESRERLRADAADDAGALRVLRDAHCRHRAQGRAVLRLDSRSLQAGSALHHPDSDGAHPDLADADHAADRHRSRAAEDDDGHAGRLHVLFPVDLGGALLYWLVSNVWGIGQQYLTNYLIGPPTVRTVRPPAERRMKRVGSEQDRCCSTRGLKMPDATQPVVDFLTRFVTALGLRTPVDVEETADGLRLNLSGEEAELLVRHRGEPLKALQHIVDMAYGRSLEDDKRVFVDALAYRKGKDVELRQMAKLLAEKAKQTGLDQQLGPLNPYERRIVHMAVAEVPGVTTESVGDAFSKTVHISCTEVTPQLIAPVDS